MTQLDLSNRELDRHRTRSHLGVVLWHSEQDLAMSDSDRPRSPFAGLAGRSARLPVRMLSRAEIEQMLAAHRLNLETEWRQGHRANFASVDLSGHDFSGLNLRGIKMDRAVLSGADFSGTQPQSATLIGVISQEARFHRADLSGARMSGQTSFRRALRTAVSPRADLEFVLMAEARCGAPACMRPDMSGAQLDIQTEEAHLARYLWALLKDARATETDRWNHDLAKLPRSLPVALSRPASRTTRPG